MSPRIQHCDYRLPTSNASRFYCLHSKVHAKNNLVARSICEGCPVRTKPCLQPRPKPSPERIEELLRELPPAPPTLRQRAWNLAESLSNFVADGLKTVSKEEYADRMAICDDCEQRRNNWCQRCGCNLTLKATGRAFRCPEDKWPTLP